MKKIVVALLVVACVISLSACAEKEDKVIENQASEEMKEPEGEQKEEAQAPENDAEEGSGGEVEEPEKDAEEGTGDEVEEPEKDAEEGSDEDVKEPGNDAEEPEIVPNYPSEDAGSISYESALGYSLLYDPTVFTLDNTGETEVYTYNTAEKLEAPIYISVQSYQDMDAQTLAEGLVLQSGVDGVEVTDTNFGAESMEVKNVCIEKEVDGKTQLQCFYAIPVAEGSILVEVSGYEGMPQTAEAKFEEMLGTFQLK